MSSKTPFLSVIIPAYNEAENFNSDDLKYVYSYLKKQSFPFELIFVDDGSTDETLHFLNQFKKGKNQVKIIANPHQGKAPTVTTGMLKAAGRNRLFTDFDQATPITEIEKLLPFRNKGYDIVIGSREIKGAKREKEPWHRHLMGKAFNIFVKLFTVQGIQDTQCGFKLFSDKATKDLFSKLQVYQPGKSIAHAYTGAFDVELLYLANKLNYKVAEVPVFWKHVATKRVNPLKDSIRMFTDLIKIRLNDIFGRYEI